jgi:NifB/MoaA-like Fe-S oxidoreductase
MNEKGEFTPEEAAERDEPTSEEIAEACQKVLAEEDCAEIAGMPQDEALGYAFTLLIENGIDDPETFLKEKGILE